MNPESQMARPTTPSDRASSMRGQEIAAEEHPPHVDLRLVVFGKLGKDGVEVPGMLADFDHFGEDGGEVVAGEEHGVGQRFTPVHGVADIVQMSLQ